MYDKGYKPSALPETRKWNGLQCTQLSPTAVSLNEDLSHALFVKAFTICIVSYHNFVCLSIVFSCTKSEKVRLKFISLNFTANGLWKLGAEFNDSRIFVRSGVLLNVFLNFFLIFSFTTSGFSLKNFKSNISFPPLFT